MTLSMSFMPAFMLLSCRSVEIESGMKPAFISGIAQLHMKLPPPWPTSKMTPRLRPSIIALLGPLVSGSCSPRPPPYMCVKMSPGRKYLFSRS